MKVMLAVYRQDGHYMVPEEDQRRVVAALSISADSLERDARSRKLAGPRFRELRAGLRAEAKAVRDLATRWGE